jgi:hypothetical protein
MGLFLPAMPRFYLGFTLLVLRYSCQLQWLAALRVLPTNRLHTFGGHCKLACI